MDAVFVLVHSPLVGPFTWSLVAEELRQREIEVVIPVLTDVEGSSVPYWRQHAGAVAQALESVPADRPLILAGHSAAGPILPVIARGTGRRIGAYLFADAGLPQGGMSWLDTLRVDAPDVAEQLRQHLASGGRWPDWSDDELRDVIPDDLLRRAMLVELHPRPLRFFEEPIPVFDGWPDAPCAYLLFSPPYRAAASQSERAGWPCRSFDAGHFHMLVDPVAVAEALVDLVQPAPGP